MILGLLDAGDAHRSSATTRTLRVTVIISDTEEVVDKAGRKSEIGYQLAKKGKELKRDMETALTANVGASAGSTSAARVTGSILAFIKTNVNMSMRQRVKPG